MFKRVLYEHWHQIIPVISLLFLLTLFIIMVVRALSMKKDKLEELSHLPLEDQPEDRHEHPR